MLFALRLRRRKPRVSSYLLAAVCGTALVVGGSFPPTDPAAAQMPPPPQNPNPAPAKQPAPNANALDAPLRLIAEARQVYKNVQDYTCTLITQERVKNKLTPETVVQMKFRQSPFSVYMKWTGPRDVAGREVCYVEGKNQNKMRAKEPKGLAALAGWVSIAPNDPRVFENSRHTILESGIGNLIEQFARAWEQERQIGKTEVKIAEYEYAGRRCTRVETVSTQQHAQQYCYRSVVYFDKEWKLPIRVENYSAPVRGGAPQGELLECFSYINIRWNGKLGDNEFNPR